MRIVLVMIISLFLIACSEETQTATSSEQATADTEPSTMSAEDEEFAAAYQEKVNKTVSDSVTKSLAREWGVSEEKIICLRKDLRISQFEDPASDPEVVAVFEKCGVDPAVAY